MKWIIIFVGLIAFCKAANNTDSKEKRQIPHSFVKTHHGFNVGGGSSINPYGSHGSSAQEEIPEEYYPAIRAYAEKQAELIQQQQIEDGMKQLLQQAGGHVVVKTIDENSSKPKIERQYAFIPKGHTEPKILTEAEYKQLVEDSNTQLAPSKSQHKQPQYPPQYQAEQQKFNYRPAEFEKSENSFGGGQHQSQFVSIPQPHQNKFAGHPLAESSLEKEIAKLEQSFGIKPSQQAYQNQRPQAQQLQYKPQFAQESQTQYSNYNSQLGLSQYAQGKPKSNSHLSTPLISVADDATIQFVTSTPSGDAGHIHSDLHRFYYQQPKKQQQQYQQQPQQNQIKYETEKPVQEPQQYRYDSRNPMKIIPSPQLQYEKPQNQPQQYFYNHQTEPKTKSEIPLDFFKNALGSTENAPSRSSIYVSQSTGPPPAQTAYKQQQFIQSQPRPQIDYQPKSNEEYEGENNQKKLETLRLPSNGRPLTQEEFHMLRSLGYKITPVPVPVPVPADIFYDKKNNYLNQHQKGQQLIAKHSAELQQYPTEDLSSLYDRSNYNKQH